MLIGRGFIATALSKHPLPEAVYYFGGISSDAYLTGGLLFKELDYFSKLLVQCEKRGEYLVYASSVTVANPKTLYSQLKLSIENMAKASGAKTLGIRLPSVYGPGEEHKGRGASVVYQFAHQMKRGESPVIYGDGNQVRDFMYIDDVTANIVALATSKETGILTLGTGKMTSFNELVETVNRVLGTTIDPVYVERPLHYIEDLPVAQSPHFFDLFTGIAKTLYEKKM